MDRILVVEDDRELNQGICFALQQAGYETESAYSTQEAKLAGLQQEYSLMILDVNLPDGEGFGFCKWIMEHRKVKVMFLTARDLEEDVLSGYELGAEDYVTKPFNSLELVARVKSQLRRYTKLGTMTPETVSNVYRTGGLEINDDMKQVTVDGRIVEKLTPIQYNILLFLTKNKGRVFSIEQIYENIWNEDAINADNTVAVHIRHIREKIEINPKEPRYLKVVWGIGYKMEDIKVE